MQPLPIVTPIPGFRLAPEHPNQPQEALNESTQEIGCDKSDPMKGFLTSVY